MATRNITITFRTRNEVETDFLSIIDWCERNGTTFNTVINSLLPALAYTLHSQVIEHEEQIYLRADWGDVLLMKNYRRSYRITT